MTFRRKTCMTRRRISVWKYSSTDLEDRLGREGDEEGNVCGRDLNIAAPVQWHRHLHGMDVSIL
jgi:hypothetical protein